MDVPVPLSLKRRAEEMIHYLLLKRSKHRYSEEYKLIQRAKARSGKWKHKPVVIVPRAEWEADPPKTELPLMVHPCRNVIYTFDTDIDLCKTREECITATQVLQKRHMEVEGADDIKYNFLVGGDGDVYEGRGYNYQPCPSLGLAEHHGDRMDIGFIGRFRESHEVPTKLMIAAFDTAQKGIDQGHVQKWYRYYEIPEPVPEEEAIESSVNKYMA